jgi:hypothetical protein
VYFNVEQYFPIRAAATLHPGADGQTTIVQPDRHGAPYPHARPVAELGTAAKNAMESGFDGVQVQANYLYLIAQFLNSATNLRQDGCGGSTANRARFLFEIIETVLEHVEGGRVGIKIGPMHLSGPFAANADTLPGMEYVVKKLNQYDLAHLLVSWPTVYASVRERVHRLSHVDRISVALMLEPSASGILGEVRDDPRSAFQGHRVETP